MTTPIPLKSICVRPTVHVSRVLADFSSSLNLIVLIWALTSKHGAHWFIRGGCVDVHNAPPVQIHQPAVQSAHNGLKRSRSSEKARPSAAHAFQGKFGDGLELFFPGNFGEH